MKKKIIIATIKHWNLQNSRNFKYKNTRIIILKTKKEFNQKKLKEIKPDYIFFPHWSWIVNKKIINNYKCICFHMTKLPYGIGGTPLQNLIIRKKKTTTLTSFRMINKIDQGPILITKKINLKGSAEEIYKKISKEVFVMIKKILKKYPKETSQRGKKTYFKRIVDSKLQFKRISNLSDFYDEIRMRDSHSYKKTCLEINDYKIEFSNAKFYKNRIEAKTIIKKI